MKARRSWAPLRERSRSGACTTSRRFCGPARNVAALALTSSVGPPHVLADLEVEDDSGQRIRLGSDAEWRSSPGLPANWREISVDQRSDWQPCVVDSGDLGILPWQPRREILATVWPLPFALRYVAGELAVIVIAALLTALACRFARSCLGGRNLRMASP